MPIRARTPEERLLLRLSRSKSLTVTDQDLSFINLSNRALLGIEFRRCELAGANFSGADLSLARFIDCNLYMTDFSESVLCTTWFYECNLTKADFRAAYLLGFRLRNVDITKANFDDVPAVGLERKSRYQPFPGVLHVRLGGDLPDKAPLLEAGYTGIEMARFNRIIAFVPDSSESDPRTKIRAAETAKYLRGIHVANGYDARGSHYYIVERRLRRQAMTGSFAARVRRAQDFIFGEVIWQYGTSVLRPILALGVLATLCTALTYLAPLASHGTGIREAGSATALGFDGWRARSLVNFLNVGYFYLGAPAGGSGAEPSGWVKVVFGAYVLLALWLIALIFDAFIKRTGVSR